MTSWAQLSYRLVVGCLLLLSLGSGSGLLAAAGCWLLRRELPPLMNVMGLVLARNYFILFQSLPN
jgi:hypothetical protein